MHPILKESYILTKESYFGFTLDQNKKALDKNRKGIKITSYIQIAVGVIFILSMLITKQKIGMLFIVLALALIITGFSGKMRIKGYEKKISESLEKSYKEREYEKNLFEVKFYDEELKYSVGEQSGELKYSENAAYYEGEQYFAIHFLSGEVIILNKTCDIEKIKDILNSYKINHADDEVKEEIIDEENDTVAKAEPLKDDWYMYEDTVEAAMPSEKIAEQDPSEKTVDESENV